MGTNDPVYLILATDAILRYIKCMSEVKQLDREVLSNKDTESARVARVGEIINLARSEEIGRDDPPVERNAGERVLHY
jgi:hypothetical protein